MVGGSVSQAALMNYLNVTHLHELFPLQLWPPASLPLLILVHFLYPLKLSACSKTTVAEAHAGERGGGGSS